MFIQLVRPLSCFLEFKSSFLLRKIKTEFLTKTGEFLTFLKLVDGINFAP